MLKANKRTKTQTKKPAHSRQPIGIFDSGLGGLTVAKEVMRRLPGENIVYLGDTARVPYGTKSRETIIRFSAENVSVLLKHKVKMVVVACNTSSSYALSFLRSSFAVPVLGVIEPGVHKAVSITQKKKIGVIATSATINSRSYEKKIQSQDPSVKVVGQACPLFVPLAEEGWVNKKVAFDIASEYLAPMKRNRVDTLILGCTHYPLLKRTIKKVMGPRVVLIDSAREVANQAYLLLSKENLLNTSSSKPAYSFLISDEPQHFKKVARQFLGFDIKKVTKYSI